MSLQLHFLATRFASVRKMRGQGGGWVLDRTWYEDAEIFARGLAEQELMSPDEWELYSRLYREARRELAPNPLAKFFNLVDDRRMRDEARIAVQLNHANIVQTSDGTDPSGRRRPRRPAKSTGPYQGSVGDRPDSRPPCGPAPARSSPR